jgi:hypothetical protein
MMWYNTRFSDPDRPKEDRRTVFTGWRLVGGELVPLEA